MEDSQDRLCAGVIPGCPGLEQAGQCHKSEWILLSLPVFRMKVPGDLQRKADVCGSMGHMTNRNKKLVRVLAVGNKQNILGQTEQQFRLK